MLGLFSSYYYFQSTLTETLRGVWKLEYKKNIEHAWWAGLYIYRKVKKHDFLVIVDPKDPPSEPLLNSLFLRVQMPIYCQNWPIFKISIVTCISGNQSIDDNFQMFHAKFSYKWLRWYIYSACLVGGCLRSLFVLSFLGSNQPGSRRWN